AQLAVETVGLHVGQVAEFNRLNWGVRAIANRACGDPGCRRSDENRGTDQAAHRGHSSPVQVGRREAMSWMSFDERDLLPFAVSQFEALEMAVERQHWMVGAFEQVERQPSIL